MRARLARLGAGQHREEHQAHRVQQVEQRREAQLRPGGHQVAQPLLVGGFLAITPSQSESISAITRKVAAQAARCLVVMAAVRVGGVSRPSCGPGGAGSAGGAGCEIARSDYSSVVPAHRCALPSLLGGAAAAPPVRLMLFSGQGRTPAFREQAFLGHGRQDTGLPGLVSTATGWACHPQPAAEHLSDRLTFGSDSSLPSGHPAAHSLSSSS